MYDKLFCENAKKVFLTASWMERLVLSLIYKELLHPTFSGKVIYLSSSSDALSDLVTIVLKKLGFEENSFKITQSLTGTQTIVEFK